ncbi:MAG TPA: hypothetical protein VKD72_11820 [Gemmataceae bacterium]|nr:hypothetical protein [Gemmataceae bacterium]
MSAAAYNNRRVAYGEIGQPERALADFAEAVRLVADPTDAPGATQAFREDVLAAFQPLRHDAGQVPAADRGRIMAFRGRSFSQQPRLLSGVSGGTGGLVR